MPQIYTELTGSLGMFILFCRPISIIDSRLYPGVDVPIICPPMAGATGGRLAAEVTRASGFGFIGVGSPYTFRGDSGHSFAS